MSDENPLANALLGTSGNDTVAGDVNGIADDVILGNAGDDLLRGLAGNDALAGGAGNDTLNGGDGSDFAAWLLEADLVSPALVTYGSGYRIRAVIDDVVTDVFSIRPNSNGSLQVTDLRAGSPEGSDQLYNTEGLWFGADPGAGTGFQVDLLPRSETYSYSYTDGNGGQVSGNGLHVGGSIVGETLRVDDYLALYPGVEVSQTSVDGGMGNDTIIGSALGDTLTGGLGNDSLVGGAGADTAGFLLPEIDSVASLSVVYRDGGLHISGSVGGQMTEIGIVTKTGEGAFVVQDLLHRNGDGSAQTDTLSGIEALMVDTNYNDATPPLWMSFETQVWSDPDHGSVSINGTPFADRIDVAGLDPNAATTDFSWVDAKSGDDTILGTDHADYLVGGTGDDLIDGGGGADSAGFHIATAYDWMGWSVDSSGVAHVHAIDGETNAAREIFEIRKAADGRVVVTGVGDGASLGVDVLDGIEQLNFGGTNGNAMWTSLSMNIGAPTTTIRDLPGPNGEVWTSAVTDGTIFSDVIDATGQHYDYASLNGRGGNDTVIGSADVTFMETLDGGEGDDLLVVRGRDTVNGGTGDDTVVFAVGQTFDALHSIVDGQRVVVLGTLDGVEHTLFELNNTGGGIDVVAHGVDGATSRSWVDLSVETIVIDDDGDLTGLAIATDSVPAGIDAPPTAILVNNLLSGVQEDVDNTQGVHVADILVFDDGRGVNEWSLTGVDADKFELRGAALWLKAGVLVDYETNTDGFTVTLEVDDPLVGATPDLTRVFDLQIADVLEPTLIGSALQEVIRGGGTPDVIFAEDGNDTVSGGGGDDTLLGGGGNDLIEGGTGRDSMAGGAGNDIYYVDTLGDRVTESAGEGGDTVNTFIDFALGDHLEKLNLLGNRNISGQGNDLANKMSGNIGANRLDGGAGNDSLTGGGGNDTLDGGIGDDRLAGGLGADVLAGGTGNDSYYVDGGDLVTESTPDGIDLGGNDTVWSTADHGLGNFFENLVLDGLADLAGRGNTLDNILTGNAGANRLDGLAGNDTLYGGGGIDWLDGGEGRDLLNGGIGGDVVSGGDGDDRLHGGVDADLLFGGAGNDQLSGDAGADTMVGGSGNDIYRVDDALDVVEETDGLGGDAGGIDTVETGLAWTLSTGVENLVLTGSDDVAGIGNAGANKLTGNAGDNLLIGEEGADTLLGGVGADTMIGGAGNDRYYVENAGDRVDETTGDGVDGVWALVDFQLSAGVETLELGGTADLSGAGTDDANTLIGNAGANVLRGLDGKDVLSAGLGDDVLDGGAGADSLTGGGGSDTFVFAGDFGRDLVYDFHADEGDVIELASTGVSDFAELSTMMDQVGDTVVITLDPTDTITLKHTTLAGLTSDHFVFADL